MSPIKKKQKTTKSVKRTPRTKKETIKKTTTKPTRKKVVAPRAKQGKSVKPATKKQPQKSIKKTTTTKKTIKHIKEIPQKTKKKIIQKKQIKKIEIISQKTKKKKKITIEDELKKDDFRVAIFGSARTKKNSKLYKQVYQLGKMVGEANIDIITGGGPGSMEAANAGHNAGDKTGELDSIGLTIKLPWEAKLNKYVEIEEHFNTFSNRLDHFMLLSSVVVITPGGVGTALELFYTWQLIQVQHICPIPVILVGKMWKDLIKWVKKHPLKKGLISPKDMKSIHIAKNNKEAIKLIKKAQTIWKKEGDKYCTNIKRYKLK